MFKLFAQEDKLIRVEGLIKNLLQGREIAVEVKKLARIAGILRSFTLGWVIFVRFTLGE